ncbi:S-layer homology domain-containing protein [Mesobacillus subterraneus]|uniref:M14 family zinc carboxypeptidase n=1 Tax=Mesobacillus subterraneus TaxID=285983 RepID=UPI00204012B4|nr:M14 family zinc carboxypeptidase [Mesobacillus subterraneus]MCM3576482.1 S-layer homology domain-containing protein [Mesobacillus subterraneus]
MRIFLSLLLLFSIFQPLSTQAAVWDDGVYSYEDVSNEIKRLKGTFPDLVDYHSLGKTAYQREVWAVKLGKGQRTVFLNGSHHAREWITTQLIMKMIEEYANAYQKNSLVGKYNARDILDEYTIWFVPMVNPDGVTLQQRGLSAFPKEVHSKLIGMNEGSREFTRWKANANGVDLNRQYPAKWENPSEASKPSWAGYKGQKPFQEKEVQYIRDFTYKIKPDITTAYHTSGEMIFWYFYNKQKARDYKLVKELSNITGYRIIGTDVKPSGRGYTDWFIQEFNKPGFTPELSSYVGNRHVPQSNFPKIWERNKTTGLWMAAKAGEIFPEKSIYLSAKMKLDKSYTLYKSPSFDSITSNTIASEIVSAKRKQGNWYQIGTSFGDRWIYVSNNEGMLYGQNFWDVPVSYWARESIDYTYENKYMVGNGPYFFPNNSVTRAEAAAVISRVYSLTAPPESVKSFSDVQQSYWAFESIEAVNAQGIMNGTSKGVFSPLAPVTREQMAAMIARLFGEEIPDVTEAPFLDVSPAAWSADSIAFVKERGIFLGDGQGIFGPQEKLTRAQFAALITRLKTNYNLQPTDNAEETPVKEEPVETEVPSEDTVEVTGQQEAVPGDETPTEDIVEDPVQEQTPVDVKAEQTPPADAEEQPAQDELPAGTQEETPAVEGEDHLQKGIIEDGESTQEESDKTEDSTEEDLQEDSLGKEKLSDEEAAS